jgi:hypothetical protein
MLAVAWLPFMASHCTSVRSHIRCQPEHDKKVGSDRGPEVTSVSSSKLSFGLDVQPD